MTSSPAFHRLAERPRVALACLPTPIQRLSRLSDALGGDVEIWMKRDDLTGLAGGGNKTRKLEFVVASALEEGADTLLTVGALQSNHTRQTAAAAARIGLDCVLLHNAWTHPPSPIYGQVGNALLSSLVGAKLLYDAEPRLIGDDGRIEEVAARLRSQGRKPYVIPGGASEHPFGGFGYFAAAREITEQAAQLSLQFDAIVHCTGSSSTQAGLLAGLTALDSQIPLVGVADDFETDEKCERVLRLANQTLDELGCLERVKQQEIEVIASDPSPYGEASSETLNAIRMLASHEGVIADPVYEGKAVLGLLNLIRSGRFRRGSRVLLMHLGGTPAVHAYADQLWKARFEPLNSFE